MEKADMRWRFINQTSPNSVIVIHDKKSADCLAEVLKHAPGDWMMQEEKSLNAKASAAVPPPAPVMKQHEKPYVEPYHHDEPEAHHDHHDESAHHEQTAKHAGSEKHSEDKKQASSKERRSQERFTAEFRVILISGANSFRTVSHDVSMGGMRLKKSIPPSFIKDNCVVYVSHKDMRENLEIVCNVIADPNDPCRIQFVKPDVKQLKRLEEWVAEKRAGGQEVA